MRIFEEILCFKATYKTNKQRKKQQQRNNSLLFCQLVSCGRKKARPPRGVCITTATRQIDPTCEADVQKVQGERSLFSTLLRLHALVTVQVKSMPRRFRERGTCTYGYTPEWFCKWTWCPEGVMREESVLKATRLSDSASRRPEGLRREEHASMATRLSDFEK